MRYAKIKYNDTANAPGIAVSVWVQGCPYRCDNCFNKETWDFNGGKEFTYDTLRHIISGLTENGIPRHLEILGGEPLCKENAFLTYLIIDEVKKALPDIKVYVWTGGIYEELIQSNIPKVKEILEKIDCLIDGPFIQNKRDISLSMRGSSNQRIIYLKDGIPDDSKV